MNNKTQTPYAKIGVLSLAHMVNDIYANFLPQLLPFLVVLSAGFSATRAAILISAFTITSSFAQPIFGFFLDHQGKRWLVHVGTIWMAVILSLTGLVHNNYILLVTLAGLAGLGTAAFHPQASTMVSILSGDRKAVILSIFVAFGNMGFALSPLLLVPLFQTFGLQSTVFTVIPGIFVAVLLFYFAPQDNILGGEQTSLTQVIASLKSSARELSSIIGVIAIRALAYSSLITLLPLYFKSQNLSNITASHLITIMLFTGAIGGIIGGFISDYYGRKRLVVGSLLACVPFFFGFFYTQGILSTIFLALAGACLLSSFSVTVIAAQEAIPDNKAFAAGLTMGFANGLGAFFVIPFGKIADIWGYPIAIQLVFLLPLAAGIIALFMKNRPAARTQRYEAIKH